MTPAPSQPQGADEKVYHVLEGPQEEERGENEEGEYYLLGEEGGGEDLTYEVPIPTIPAPAQPATQQVAETMEYTPHCSTSDWTAVYCVHCFALRILTLLQTVFTRAQSQITSKVCH